MYWCDLMFGLLRVNMSMNTKSDSQIIVNY